MYFEDEEGNEVTEEFQERRHNLSHLSEDELQKLIDKSVDSAFTKSLDKLMVDISKEFFKKLIWGAILSLVGFAVGNHLIK